MVNRIEMIYQKAKSHGRCNKRVLSKNLNALRLASPPLLFITDDAMNRKSRKFSLRFIVSEDILLATFSLLDRT